MTWWPLVWRSKYLSVIEAYERMLAEKARQIRELESENQKLSRAAPPPRVRAGSPTSRMATGFTSPIGPVPRRRKYDGDSGESSDGWLPVRGDRRGDDSNPNSVINDSTRSGNDDTTKFRSGHGGDFGGAGASGSWSDDGHKPSHAVSAAARGQCCGRSSGSGGQHAEPGPEPRRRSRKRLRQ